MKKQTSKSPTKSPQKPPTQSLPQSTPIPQPQNSPQLQKIQTLKTNFHKSITLPIQNLESIEHSKSPQRCLLHNTMLTLYCQIDRKTLCASCMYQQDTHRKHRVIPIGRALGLVREDILGFQIKLEGCLKQCTAIGRSLQERIVRNQRYYPSVVEQLKKYYVNFIAMLKEKQQEQIAQILQHHQKLRNQILYLDQQLKKISNTLHQKLKPAKKLQTQDTLLTRRSILQVLTKVNKIINNEIANVFHDDEEYDGQILDFGLWGDVEDLVRKRLVVVLPGVSVSPRLAKGVVFQAGVQDGYLGVRSRSKSKLVDPAGHNKTVPNFRKQEQKYQKPRSTSNKKGRREVTFALP